MSPGCLVAVDIMHRLSVELRAVLGWVLIARREIPMVAMPVVKMMIYMPIKVFRPVEPRPRANKKAARKPLGSVVAIWRAVIRRSLIIAIRTNRRLSDTDCNLCIRFLRGTDQASHRQRHYRNRS